jgi:tubulin polyglutamylase TTLL5
MLTNAPPTLGYAKNHSVESKDLLYKVLRGDTKLVRSIFEAHGFKYTESHEWNMLWSSGICKNYLYEGLNEYQKINHFPQSYEITRKDRLSVNVQKMQEKYGY